VKPGNSEQFRLAVGATIEAQLAGRCAAQPAEYLAQVVATRNEAPLVLGSDETDGPFLFVFRKLGEPPRRFDVVDFKIEEPESYLRRRGRSRPAQRQPAVRVGIVPDQFSPRNMTLVFHPQYRLLSLRLQSATIRKSDGRTLRGCRSLS
jgi:hypothetical protein